MNSTELTQSLAEIAKAEEAVRKLEADRAKLDASLAEARRTVSDLKRALAVQLRGYLSDLEGGGKPTAEGKRARGVSAAIVRLLADGRPRPPVEIAAELAAQGLPTRSVTAAISLLYRQGRIARPSRGRYAQAADAAKQ